MRATPHQLWVAINTVGALDDWTEKDYAWFIAVFTAHRTSLLLDHGMSSRWETPLDRHIRWRGRKVIVVQEIGEQARVVNRA